MRDSGAAAPERETLPSASTTTPKHYYDGYNVETVAVPLDTTAYNHSDSLPVVGTRTEVFAAIGNPVVVVTPDPPMYAAALEDTGRPSESGAEPTDATKVAW